MRRATLAIVGLILLSAFALGATEPSFQDYPARNTSASEKPRIDFQSPVARKFRTRIRAALKGSPNFAGRYYLIQVGCGSECTNLVLVDAATGKVIDPGNLALADVDFRLSSHLL